MIYFNKLIDICINRQESQKVVDNYANGTNKEAYELLRKEESMVLYFLPSSPFAILCKI